MGNDTATATGSLNLLFGEGTTKPAETGLRIASDGVIAFAPKADLDSDERPSPKNPL